MHAAECCFFSVDDFSVAAFVDLAAAVSALVQAGFDSDGDQAREAFEKSRAQLFSFFGQFEDFLFLLAHGFHLMLDEAFFFELLKERVDEARADFFSDSLFEAIEDAVAVDRSFV